MRFFTDSHLSYCGVDLLSHIQNTNSQYNMEPFGTRITYKANRQAIAEQFLDPDVRTSIEADLELIALLLTRARFITGEHKLGLTFGWAGTRALISF